MKNHQVERDSAKEPERTLFMKYSFILLFLFSAVFHFIMPYLYYYTHEFHSAYQAANVMIFDQKYLDLALYINVSSLFLASLIVYFLPNTKKIQPVNISWPTTFFVCSFISTFIFFWMSGGFFGVLEGRLHGTWISYILLFLGMAPAFALSITHIKNTKYLVIIILQVLLALFSGSRSAPVFLLINFFLLLGVNLSRKKLFIYLILVLVSGVSSIFLFDLASFFRGASREGVATVVSSNTQTNVQVFKENQHQGLLHIIDRASCLELAMIPMIYKDKNINKEKLSFFYEKYSIKNQLRLFTNFLFPARVKNYANSIFPGLFKFDVLPNQYYRTVFLGMPKEVAAKNYLSLNITFPSYIYMYSNAIIAVIAYTFALVLIYFLAFYVSRFSTVLAVLVFMNAYTFIYFFDLTDVLVTSLRSLLTAFSFIAFYSLIKSMSLRKPSLELFFEK